MVIKMNEKINFANEVIAIYKNIVVVKDDYDNLYYIDNDGFENAYELGDCISSADLSPFSDLPDDIANTIWEEL